MDNDFNPLDLSAAKRPENEPELTPKATVQVYKVGRGSLLHSRFTKVTVTLMLIVLLGIGSYIATSYYLIKHPDLIKTPSVIKPETTANPNVNPDTTEPISENPSTSTDSKIYCGVAGMPEGVCTAITSIEKDGIKNNKYISADTSQIPDAAVANIQEQTWVLTGDDSGTISFVLTFNFKEYPGSAVLKNVGGTWKAVAFKQD